MDIQVQELIDKIKKDGIEAASEEAARIKLEADTEASQVIQAAQKEAADIIEKAKQNAQRSEKAGIATLEQASRNLVLAFKGEIQSLLDKIVAEELSKSYNDDVLKTVLPEILKAWPAKGINSLSVVVSEASLDKILAFFKTKLAVELKKGVELKSDNNLTAGFNIVNQDGSAYYDFSAESVAELLSAYLNPRISEILKASTKEL